jgi:hypothetical protein
LPAVRRALGNVRTVTDTYDCILNNWFLLSNGVIPTTKGSVALVVAFSIVGGLLILGLLGSLNSDVPLGWSRYYVDCQDLARQTAKYPSSFETEDMDALHSQTAFKQTSVVWVGFTVKNAFGLKVAGKARCAVNGGVVHLYEVTMEDGTHLH